MGRYFTPKQLFVLVTAFIACSILMTGWFFTSRTLPAPVFIQATGCPTWGKKDASVQMVLFEDFFCSGCKIFNIRMLPKIQEHYIDPGRVRFTLVPLAFLEGSQPLANAVLAVYHIAPDRLLPYLHGLGQGAVGSLETNTPVEEQLINFAKVVDGIDLLQFKACVKTKCHEEILEKNLVLAQEVMGEDWATPTLYVNGVPCSTISFEAIQTMIEHFERGSL